MNLKVEKVSEKEWASMNKEAGVVETQKHMVWVDVNAGEVDYEMKTYVFRDTEEPTGERYIKTDARFYPIEEKNTEQNLFGWNESIWRLMGPAEWANEAFDFDNARICKMRFKTTTTNKHGGHFPVTSEMVKQELKLEDEDILLGVRKTRFEEMLHVRRAERVGSRIDGCELNLTGEREEENDVYEQCYYVQKEDEILKVTIDIEDAMKDVSEEYKTFEDEASMREAMVSIMEHQRKNLGKTVLVRNKKRTGGGTSSEWLSMNDDEAIKYIEENRYRLSFPIKDEESFFNFEQMKKDDVLRKEDTKFELKEWGELSIYKVSRRLVEEWLEENKIEDAKVLFVLEGRTDYKEMKLESIDEVKMNEERIELDVSVHSDHQTVVVVEVIGYKWKGKFRIEYIEKIFNSKDAQKGKRKGRTIY